MQTDETHPSSLLDKTNPEQNSANIKRWNTYLANERAEAATYRKLATRAHGKEREILLALAEAEKRHETHWLDLLGPHAKPHRRPSLRVYMFSIFSRCIGPVFTLALAQRYESLSPYGTERDATAQMHADEQIHEEVIRALTHDRRTKLSGTFRAAIFGLNDGLVSNLALILGVVASNADKHFVLMAGFSGLLAGALSMAAGEYVSVRSQRELLKASRPNLNTTKAIEHLDINENELALVYRARGLNEEDARICAEENFAQLHVAPLDTNHFSSEDTSDETVGNPWAAARSSFLLFALGAALPLIPLFLNVSIQTAGLLAAIVVGLALLVTGSIVGILSGAPPFSRALRQLAIGYGAATATYLLGLAFETVLT